MTRSNKLWASIILLLIVVIVVGSIIIWSKYSPSQPIKVTISPSPEINGQISIDGGVDVPGIYPLRDGDSVDALLQAAGGTTTDADLNRIKLHIPYMGEADTPQKVNLNHADAWLLQALPGIGETKAQAIIDYRQQNGQFRHISEITKVEGIGVTTYEKIKHLVTVSD
ncbi:MAG TPA: ComEA family DNA-binding protein [Dehalococcoidales bacterium]|nr:ComEA family DNA-binding protein [Dehalococcoidales bacterium]